METINKNEKLESSHGIVASYPDQFFGYFGWPTITRMQDGTLLAAASGLRNYHVCPFGRTIICTSNDDGKTWTSPRVINDSPFDDRDAGILCVKGENLVLSWFTTDNRSSIPSKYEKGLSDWEAKIWKQGIASMTDEAVTDFVGSWIEQVRMQACHGMRRFEYQSQRHMVQSNYLMMNSYILELKQTKTGWKHCKPDHQVQNI